MSLRQQHGTPFIRRVLVSLAGLALAAGFLALADPGSALAEPAAAASAQVTGPASYVNPFIGTGNGGGQVGAVEEYPGPDAPFGMIQWGPETGPTGSTVGYNYDDTTLTGFSLTRLGGVGCGIFQDFEFLPTTSSVTASPGTSWGSYTSGFSHSNELASTAYYQVTTANGIKTQLTTGTRAALGEFTYPVGSQQVMLINAASSSGNLGSTLQVVSPDTITGSATGGGFCGHHTQRYTVYFAVTFSQPFASSGTWQGGTITPGSTSVSGESTGGWVSFGTSTSAPIQAKVAISYVSVAGAEGNQATISDSFQAVHAQTYGKWNALLGKIDVSGGTAAEEQTFYTELYHALLDPSVYSDADGQYMGFDFKVHTVPAGHTIYSNFSGWDIYRSEVPLLALLVPQQASDMMQSLVDDAEQGGWLPKWPTANTYTGMMGGDSADPIIADAYAFGARDFDATTALQYMLKGANDTSSPEGQGVYLPRGTEYLNQAADGDYLAEGYVPTGSSTSADGSSLTEEFALDDFTIGQFAAAIGQPATAAIFAARGQNWENVFDPGVADVAPRGPQAPASTNPSPTGASATQADGFEEGDAVQYLWMIPQNLSGLFAALGGDKVAASRLDTYFTQLNAGPTAPYDWQGNETTLNDAWEYDYLGQPWQTQDVVREVITQLYGTSPSGAPGNDDLGAMSSWYVWGALGLFPETPGTSTLALGSPLFPRAVIHEGGGYTITINAPGATAATPYVQSLTLNGDTDNRNYLTAAQYTHGATLNYTLGTTADTTRGTAPQDDPPSYTAGESPAIGFTTPYNETSVPRGSATTVQVGAQSITTRPQAVHWSVAVPAGISITPSSGTLDLKPGQQATTSITIGGIGATLPGGEYSAPISFTEAGHQVSTTSLYLQVAPALTVTVNRPNLNLAAGGWSQASYTITNNVQNAPMTVSLAGPGVLGVTASLSATSLTLRAGGSATVTATLANPNDVTTGNRDYTVTATDTVDNLTASAATDIHLGNDLALNEYQTPWPAASASSSQSANPPSAAVDGNTATFWASGSAPTPSGPVDFTEDFGSPVTIGAVTMTPVGANGPTAYTIQSSTDGQNWTTIGTVTDASASGATTTTVAPIAAQYLRLEIIGTHQSGGAAVEIAELDIAAPPPPIAVTAAEPDFDLAAGGWNQVTYTVTNNTATTASLAFAGTAPSEVTATLSSTSATIPAGGSATVTATFTSSATGVATGTGLFTLTATDASASLAGSGASVVHFTSDLALNTYQTPWPAPSATSSQSAYPPYMAVDGNTGTWWVSGSQVLSQATPLDLTVDFGVPVTIGSATMTPRPAYGPTDYTIETSDDGQNWTTIATVTNASVDNPTTTTVTPVTAQYLRLVITGGSQIPDNNVQVGELAVTA